MIRGLILIAVLAGSANAQVAVCAGCHAEIAAKFSRTGMGRSFSAATGTESLAAAPYFHAASGAYFAMVQRSGQLFQRRWELGPDGKLSNVEEKSVDFVLGSGNHAKTYLHLTARGTLQQLPLGWYAEKGGYLGMNPGYDRSDYPGSTRAITYECMACHNAFPKIPAANREAGAEARYVAPLPQGIDCQRCHGAGTEHAASGGSAALVNPAKLDAARQLEVCMQCHLETSSRLLPHSIQRHGRGPFSYAAGQPLGDFTLAFDRAAGKNDAVEVAGGAYRFRQSACFLKSEGKLRCTTCHDPHDIPRGEPATAAYNKVCAACHTAERGAHRAGENCVGCHMPKTRTDDAVHIVITDHRIQPGPLQGDLTAEKAEIRETPENAYRGPVAPYYPAQADALYTAVAQVRDGSNLAAGLAQLARLVERQKPAASGFWVDLGEAYRASGDLAKAARAFEAALARAPQSTVIALKLGNALIEARRWVEAETALRKVSVRAPSDPLAWGLLGWALWQLDRRVEARAALEKSVKLDPELAEIRNYLASFLRGTRDMAGAEREFREAVRLLPGVAEWRTNLGGVLAVQGKTAEARYEFERAINLKPGDAASRFEYGRFLAATGDEAKAEEHARAAVAADGKMAGARELWGALLLNRGDLAGAVRELGEAVRLAPDFARAQFELGAALYAKGDATAGVEHLRIAIKLGDPNAAEYLRKLGR
ncbi:MAG: tetratricopeptide repeat protein [Candidatus Solibacter sp.]